MHKNVPSGLPNFWQRSCKPVLSVIWILGLVLGMCLAAEAGDSFSLMMRGEFLSAVSIPGLLLVTALPFFLTALAVFLSQPWLLSVLVLAKAVSYGACAFGIMTAYGSASWLVWCLLMFTDLGSLPLLMWLWLRFGDMTHKPPILAFAVCAAAVTALGILDVLIVSPFAALLL